MPRLKRNRSPSKPPSQAIIYARFSPRPIERVKATDSIEYQEEACRNYCAGRGYEVLAVHADRSLSGADIERPGLTEAIEDAVGCEGILVAVNLSRLTRSMFGMAEIMDRLHRGHANIAVLDMDIDTSTATGRFMLDFIVRIYQWEREIIGERTSNAMLSYQAAGRSMGGNPPYGWKVGDGVVLNTQGQERKQIVENPDELPTLQRIIDMAARGMTYRRICATLNAENVPARAGVWSPTKISRIIARHDDAAMPAGLCNSIASSRS